MKNHKFILGTAQLGMFYGIANACGQPSFELAQKIIAFALTNGITYFDTAKVYGTSEQVLGKCLTNLSAQMKVKIITKVTSESLRDKDLLKKSLDTSMQNLNIQSLYCFMLHHEECLSYLNAWQGDFLQDQQTKGRIRYLGISVYEPDLALQALEHPFIQIVQIPSSLFDRRFITAGVFEKAKKLGKKIHVRSIFLQGVLCISSKLLPRYLFSLHEGLDVFHWLCEEYGCTPAQAALAWMQYRKPEAYLIFGAENNLQIHENVNISWQKNCNIQEFLKKIDAIHVPQEAKILNPALWSK